MLHDYRNALIRMCTFVIGILIRIITVYGECKWCQSRYYATSSLELRKSQNFSGFRRDGIRAHPDSTALRKRSQHYPCRNVLRHFRPINLINGEEIA